MNSTRPSLIVLLLIAALLSACAAPATPAAPAAPAPTQAPAEAAATEAPSAPAPTEGAASESRDISHALGTLTIEGTPARIVALEWTYAEDLLALGIQPAGVADVEGYNAWVNVEPALAADVADVGTRQEPNLEAILELEPDLIIGVQFRHEPIYDDLAAIAPTLLFNPYPEDESITQYAEMEQTFLAIGDAVNRRAEAEAVLADLEAHLAETAEAIAATGKQEIPFVVTQAFTSGDAPQLRLFTDNSMTAELMSKLGMTNGWDGAWDVYGFTTTGVESLTEVQDVNFFYVVQDSDNVFETTLAGNPVWEDLTFVKEGRTYPLGGDTWLFGGPLSAQLVADKVAELLQ